MAPPVFSISAARQKFFALFETDCGRLCLPVKREWLHVTI
jgi:hypothetical protein